MASKQALWSAWLLVGAAPAWAADAPGLDQSFWFQISGYRPSIESKLQYSPNSGASGTELSFERDLGLADRKTLPALLIGARFGDGWRGEFEYFKLSRSARQNLVNGSITVDDTVYPVTANVASQFDSQVYRLGLGYSFFKTRDAEVGAVAGVHVTDFKVALEGDGLVNGQPVASRREQRDEVVPLPTLGVYAGFAFAPNWVAAGRIDVLSLKVGDYRGKLLNVQANLVYRFTPNVGLGLGYRYDDYKLKANRGDWRGRLEYKFSGPQVLVDVGF